jgi:hypothetical protein
MSNQRTYIPSGGRQRIVVHDGVRRDTVPVPQLERDSRPGRNEPCVCGSGRKFKKCCGGDQ